MRAGAHRTAVIFRLFTHAEYALPMKRLLLLLLLLPTVAAQAATRDTLLASDFGLRPGTYRNATEAFAEALRACARHRSRVLRLEPGRYDIWPDGAVRREYFITNTSSEEECPSKVKTLGILFDRIEGLTVEGNGAELIFHGKITPIVFDRCRDVTLRDLSIDFERPGGSELTYVRTDEGCVEVLLHRDSRYAIVDGRIRLYGEGWLSERNHCIEYDPDAETFRYSEGWKRLAASEAVEVAPGRVRFATPAGFRPKAGNTLTVRDIIRDQVGMFVYRSRGITLEGMDVRYMHGLGIVSQYSRDLAFRRVRCAPREGSGRLLASSADFMHFSGCSGRITVEECRFAGAHDDGINIHGTNLRAVARSGRRALRLRFMHPQSYGYDAYFEGDTVAFVRAAAMERFATARVRSVRRLSDREVEVAFDRPVPEALEIGRDCVENLTCTPEVEIRGCHFSRTSTRGTLVTTPRRTVISGNTYYRTGMSAILVEGDAEGWYESGPVCDLLIENNTFIDCAYAGGPAQAAIALNPSNTAVDPARPVHRNVRIRNNTFRTSGRPAIYAKSTAGLLLEGNRIDNAAPEGCDPSPLLLLTGCDDVVVRDNRTTGTSRIETSRMEGARIETDL